MKKNKTAFIVAGVPLVYKYWYRESKSIKEKVNDLISVLDSFGSKFLWIGDSNEFPKSSVELLYWQVTHASNKKA